MINDNQPLVSVLTPVYNGEKYLVECIESVLAQTYQHWEYIIVNNCSTDRTAEIVRNYAEKDSRISIHNNKNFCNVIQNHNHAFRLISEKSKYCKVLQADDWLFPECVEKMVEVGEAHPSVGIVSSYRLDDVKVNCDGLRYPSTITSGRDVCRSALHGKLFVFGSPSTILIRSDLLRKRETFYNENNLHADTESCFDVLQAHDFGFVHQVLSFTRRENETNTTFARKFNTYILGDLIILQKYGASYLNDNELKSVLKIRKKEYHRFLASLIFRRRKKEIWDYHKQRLTDLRYQVSYGNILWIFFGMLYNRLFNVFKLKI
jgi:glycosyltransferase involved in cell wall biosynthesis